MVKQLAETLATPPLSLKTDMNWFKPLLFWRLSKTTLISNKKWMKLMMMLMKLLRKPKKTNKKKEH
jgi:hypothetical protein